MKLHSLIGLMAIATALAGCSRQTSEPAPGAATESAGEPKSRVQRGPDGRVVVTLDRATQKLAGLQTAVLQAVSLRPEIKGYGRVLDIAPLAALTAETASALAASLASQRELDRLKALVVHQNASDRALQAAEAAAVRDRTQLESNRRQLRLRWGPSLAERPDLSSLVDRLCSLTNALVQLDLPAGEHLSDTPTGARLQTLDERCPPIEALYLGPAPAVSGLQGRSYLFLVETNSIPLPPGAAVTGWLALPGEATMGVKLPREAVVYQNGTAWAYRQAAEEKFERVEVSPSSPFEDGWFVREQLKPGDTVVIVGSQELLSEERKGDEIE